MLEMLRSATFDFTMSEFETLAILELITKVSLRLQNLYLKLAFSKPGNVRRFSISYSEAWALSKTLHSVSKYFGGIGICLEIMVNDALQQESFKIQQYGTKNRFAKNSR